MKNLQKLEISTHAHGTLVNLRGSVSFKCSKFLFMQGHSVKMVYCQYLGIGVEGKEFSFTQS